MLVAHYGLMTFPSGLKHPLEFTGLEELGGFLAMGDTGCGCCPGSEAVWHQFVPKNVKASKLLVESCEDCPMFQETF